MLSRAFDHICMEKARYKFLIIIIIISSKSPESKQILNEVSVECSFFIYFLDVFICLWKYSSRSQSKAF